MFFDNLQVVHTRVAMLEETHYYPFGLTMAGLSSKALAFGDPANNIKYQGYELSSAIDLNIYESFFRTYDPQIGRFFQIDPKPSDFDSPFVGFGNDPIRNIDILGDTSIVPQQGGKIISESTSQGYKALKERISIGPVNDLEKKRGEVNNFFPKGEGNLGGQPFTADGATGEARKGKGIVDPPENLDGLIAAMAGAAKLSGLEFPFALEGIQILKEFTELKEGEKNEKLKKEPAFIENPKPVKLYFDKTPANGEKGNPQVKWISLDPHKPDTFLYPKKQK